MRKTRKTASHLRLSRLTSPPIPSGLVKSLYFSLPTFRFMGSVNAPETGLLAPLFVGCPFPRVIYVHLFLFPDCSADRFEAWRLTCSSSILIRPSLDLPEKHCGQRWTLYSSRPSASLRFPSSLP